MAVERSDLVEALVTHFDGTHGAGGLEVLLAAGYDPEVLVAAGADPISLTAAGFGPAPAKRVEQPYPQPPTISLLTGAPKINETDLRWANKYEWLQRGYGADGTGVCNADADVMPISTIAEGKEQWAPFLVVAGLQDSAFDYNALDWTERVLNKLAVAESFLIEKEIWTNSTEQAPAKIGGSGCGATLLTSGAVSPGVGLAILVGEWANVAQGIRGYIHTSEQALMLMEESWAVRREGNQWLTAADNVIIPGRGYVLDGPTGQSYGLLTQEYAYITATPYIRMGPIEIIPPSFPNTFMQAMDRSSNDVRIYAARLVSVAWDLSAPHYAVEIDKSATAPSV